jgi:hypothetical protein
MQQPKSPDGTQQQPPSPRWPTMEKHIRSCTLRSTDYQMQLQALQPSKSDPFYQRHPQYDPFQWHRPSSQQNLELNCQSWPPNCTISHQQSEATQKRTKYTSNHDTR